ncbi:MAG: helix-turn-helix domain-containing protein [Candidatus Competibacteraceae bacterium]|nr:helix-turn-helix domain-containing protein [Candidatus Competibacteraceae bacterium]
MTVKATSSIQVITRLSLILDALAAHDEPVSLKALSSTTGLHPSTAFRILASLIEHGFVERSIAGHYRLGVRLLQLGSRVHGRIERRPLVHALAASPDEWSKANG